MGNDDAKIMNLSLSDKSNHQLRLGLMGGFSKFLYILDDSSGYLQMGFYLLEYFHHIMD